MRSGYLYISFEKPLSNQFAIPVLPNQRTQGQTRSIAKQAHPMPFSDTIVAMATPHGESAIAMIRLSGPACRKLIQDCFGQAEATPRMSCYKRYKALDDKYLDECLYAFYEAPASYTGEDMLEVCLHGNPVIAQKMMEDLVARGCRIAQAGEFTRTAFLNGKMDLAQAEAVADIISARSEQAISVAQNQLQGALGNRIDKYVQQLLGFIAELEAFIDFPDEDLPEENLRKLERWVSELSQQLKELIRTAQYKELLQSGIKTVIVGQPNVGKSSLLNALVGDERAIVSDQPGTTRDYIAERAIIDAYEFIFTDTAGIHNAGDDIEAIGIQKTLQNIKTADLFLVMLDASLPCPQFDEQIIQQFNPEHTIVIENKMDLPNAHPLPEFLAQCPHVSLSLRNGQGFEQLKAALVRSIESGITSTYADNLIVNSRHASALKNADAFLQHALQCIQQNQASELAVAELREAIASLGEIVGQIDNEAMLDVLFSNFCIGK